MDKRCTLIHWFRKGLRVHDNPALAKVFSVALSNPKNFSVRPIFVLDPGILSSLQVGANRWRFLQQSLMDLHYNLVKLNSCLYVIRGDPEQVFSQLFVRWHVQLLTFESDIEPYSQNRDEKIKQLAKAAGVQVSTFCSHTLYNPDLVIQRNLGKAPRTYQKFLAAIENIKIPQPIEKPPKLFSENKPEKDENEEQNENYYDCPSLEEMVKKPNELGPNKYLGGETEALHRLETVLFNEAWVAAFEKPNTAPNSLEPSTTVLSPYLKFGCLSVRLFHQQLICCLNKQRSHSKPPVSLLGQLLWREFYYTAGSSDPNFNRMIGNSFCLQIPWEANASYLEAWTHGRTGYPFIDAIMRQLRKEGWIHHLARHAVACFLTRGDLWISWEEGQKVFEELLLDQDWALNAGNWMWLSASAFFHQYFRVYSPVSFGKKTDPTGAYIRKYVPELAKYPTSCIYEPWKASSNAQRDYGCVLGIDYPNRIVVHETIHKINIKRMTDAYKVNKEVRVGKIEIEDNEQGRSTGVKRKAKNSNMISKRRK